MKKLSKISLNEKRIGYLDCVNWHTRTGFKYCYCVSEIEPEKNVYFNCVDGNLGKAYVTREFGIAVCLEV